MSDSSIVPELVMVVGPNGSGKTTLTRGFLELRTGQPPVPWINADELAREQQMDAGAAQRLAAQLRAELIERRSSFTCETVGSHPSRIAELQLARRAGFRITVVFVSTEHPDINVARVRRRVREGGHDVPEARTRSRYAKTMQLAASYMLVADEAFVFDTSRGDSTRVDIELQAVKIGDLLVLRDLVPDPAAWIRALVHKHNSRIDQLNQFFVLGASDEIGDVTVVVPSLDLEDASESAMITDQSAVMGSLANVRGSAHDGMIARVTDEFVLQFDMERRVNVVHDRRILECESVLPELQSEVSYCIRYRDGPAEIRPSDPETLKRLNHDRVVSLTGRRGR